MPKRKLIIGVPEGTYKKYSKLPTHEALDYAILYYTKADRLISTVETAKVSGYTFQGVSKLCKKGHIPALYDKHHYYVALETALFLKELNDSGLVRQRRFWKSATDRTGWKARLQPGTNWFKWAIRGRGVQLDKKRTRLIGRIKRYKALHRKPTITKRYRKKDPFTNEMIYRVTEVERT